NQVTKPAPAIVVRAVTLVKTGNEPRLLQLRYNPAEVDGSCSENVLFNGGVDDLLCLKHVVRELRSEEHTSELQSREKIVSLFLLHTALPTQHVPYTTLFRSNQITKPAPAIVVRAVTLVKTGNEPRLLQLRYNPAEVVGSCSANVLFNGGVDDLLCLKHVVRKL